jgi:galactose mutarotase-like enzyme
MLTQLSSDQLKITINSLGAELCSVKNNKDVEFIWQANKDVWARHAPVLFPVVGKLKDNFFVFDEKKYELPQHGFARDAEFNLKQSSSSSCTFELTSNSETKQKFPFDFVFQIQYELKRNKLTTTYNVFNLKKTNIIKLNYLTVYALTKKSN